MADKFPYLARQMNGPIADSFGKGFDHVYETDLEFIEFLSRFSLEELSGKWLDRLGMILGMPRPYYTTPTSMDAFMFDSTEWIINAVDHGFSTVNPIKIGNKTYTRKDGGLLDDTFKDESQTPMVDKDYRRYIYSICAAKNTRSLKSIENVVKSITKSSMFVIRFNDSENNAGDMVISLPYPLVIYQDIINTIFKKVFTVSPLISVDFDPYFFDNYIINDMEHIIRSVTNGSNDFEITYIYDVTILHCTIKIGYTISEYKDDIQIAMDKRFGLQEDLIIDILVSTSSYFV